MALGSNVGDSLANLQEATELLSQLMILRAVSHVYETAPVAAADRATALIASAIAECQVRAHFPWPSQDSRWKRAPESKRSGLQHLA